MNFSTQICCFTSTPHTLIFSKHFLQIRIWIWINLGRVALGPMAKKRYTYDNNHEGHVGTKTLFFWHTLTYTHLIIMPPFVQNKAQSSSLPYQNWQCVLMEFLLSSYSFNNCCSCTGNQQQNKIHQFCFNPQSFQSRY